MSERLSMISQVNQILRQKSMKNMEQIKDKGQTIYNFPKDIIAKDGELLIPYNDTYHLYFKVVSFYLYMKYDLCNSKCQSEVIPESESITSSFQRAERL